MPRPETLERTAKVSRTLHDGTNMIVLRAGKRVRFAKSSLGFLIERDAIEAEKGDAEAPAPAASAAPATKPVAAKAVKTDAGKRGGKKTTAAAKPPSELAALRKRYKELFGKQPAPSFAAAKVKELIAAKEQAGGGADDEAPTS